MNIHNKTLIKIENIASKIMQEKSLGKAYLGRKQDKDAIYYHFTSIDSHIPVQQLVNEVDSYFKGGSPVVVNIYDNLVKRKSLTRFLSKEKIEDPLLGQLFNCFLNPPSFNIHLDTLKVAFEESEEFAKKIAIKICDSFATRKFKTQEVQHCELLLKEFFKIYFKENEYKSLHHFFNYYKEAILSHPGQTQDLVADFLKNKINHQHWDSFAQYCPKDSGFKKVENNSLPIIEINSNPTYNIIINDDAIRLKYPLISSQPDIKKMMDNLVKLVNKNCDQLGLSKAFYSDWTDKQTFIYLTAKSSDSANMHQLEKIFFSLIDAYSTRFTEKNTVSSSDLDTIFQYSYMESSLENKKNTISNKKKI